MATAVALDSSPANVLRSMRGSIVDARLGTRTFSRSLLCKLSNGSLLDVKPGRKESDDDPPNWELITPGGVLLEFGPGVRWQISSADEPAPSRR